MVCLDAQRCPNSSQNTYENHQKTTKNLVCFFPNPVKINHGTPKSVGRSNFHLQERFFRFQERFWPSRGVPRRAIFFRHGKIFSIFFKLFSIRNAKWPVYKLALCNVQHLSALPVTFSNFLSPERKMARL